MSYDAYTRRQFEEDIYAKLMEAEMQARTTTERYSPEDVRARLRALIEKRERGHVQS